MNIEDSGEFGRRLTALAELFDVKMSPQRAALTFEALRDVPFAAVAGALNHAAKTCKFFPRPAELRSFAIGDVEDVIEAAWVGFRRALSSAGYMASVIVDDAALGETILAMFGSWPQACGSDFTPEMWAAKRKEFGRIYRVMTNRQLEGSRYLLGAAEAQNQGRPEWQKWVPGARIDRTGQVGRLTVGEMESARTQLATTTHALAQLESGVRTFPGESA